ncbi:MAG: DUF1788 domain-containing protein [Thermomicrobiales bacterium]
MLSLDERIALLEADLLATPTRIGSHADLPFAVLRYDPTDEGEQEWALRRHLQLLRPRLQARGKQVAVISLADLLWEAVDTTEGMAALVAEEQDFDYSQSEETLTRLLSDPDFAPLPDLVAARLAGLDPTRTVAFLVRAGALAPGIYHMSKLLDEMQGRTMVPTVLCYPGSIEGTTGLRFMNLPRSEPMGNYRVKIYG